jgi:hypothetical protein
MEVIIVGYIEDKRMEFNIINSIEYTIKRTANPEERALDYYCSFRTYNNENCFNKAIELLSQRDKDGCEHLKRIIAIATLELMPVAERIKETSGGQCEKLTASSWIDEIKARKRGE